MFRKLAIPLAVAGATFASAPAHAAFEDFCVSSVALAGVTATTPYNNLINGSNGCTGVGSNSSVLGFTADKFNGGYTERLVVTATSDQNVLAFQSTVFISWGQFFRNDGGTQISGAASLLNSQYGLYSIVEATGTLSGGSFSATSATLSLWADRFNAVGGDITEQTTTGGIPDWTAGLAPVLTGTADDALLATGSYSGGFGQATSPGRFTFTFTDLQLTALGNAFFIAPKPFYVDVLSDGDVDTAGFNVTGPGQFDLVGDVSANFFVPEPGVLALTGLGLALIGLGSRRRKV